MKTKKILLVEDNPDDATLIKMSLEKGGMAQDVVTLRDGQAAIEYLRKCGSGENRDGFPVVVLLDLKLPKLDGLEVLERLRAEPKTRLQPVVILTSSDEARDRLKSYDLGANSYVCKPVDSGEFNEAVDRLGCYWTRLNKTPMD